LIRSITSLRENSFFRIVTCFEKIDSSIHFVSLRMTTVFNVTVMESYITAHWITTVSAVLSDRQKVLYRKEWKS